MNAIAKYIFTSIVVLNTLIQIEPVIAHTVKTDANVGATFHIEPNHNPRAGENSQAWFALTLAGGKLIPLKKCNCQLQVYRQGETTPILQPELISITAENYQDLPAADLIFPQPGIYTLVLTGNPNSDLKFQPFKLTYDVTVSPGREKNSQPNSTTSTTALNKNKQNSSELKLNTDLLVTSFILVILVVSAFTIIQKIKK